MRVLSSAEAKAIAAKRTNFGRRNPRAYFIKAQQLLLKDVENPKTSPAIRSKCVIAMCKAEDMIRILSGKPLPGQLRPDLVPKKQRKGPAVLPMPEVPPLPIDEVKASPA
jgi:hypothetical protein